MAGLDSNTQLLLHLNNNVTDSSSNNFTITNSNVTFSNTTPLLDSTYYGVFNGSARLITPSNSIFTLGTSDFTWDFFVKWTTVSNSGLVSKSTDINNRWYLEYYSGVFYAWFKVANVVMASYSFSFTPIQNQVYHFATVRNGSNFYIFKDGVSQTLTTTVAISTNNIDNTNSAINIGYGIPDNVYLTGQMDEVRFSNVARWTSNFTPPTTEYTADSTRFMTTNKGWL